MRGLSVAVRGNADGAHRPRQLCTPTVLTARMLPVIQNEHAASYILNMTGTEIRPLVATVR
jgi:hypothetical protein